MKSRDDDARPGQAWRCSVGLCSHKDGSKCRAHTDEPQISWGDVRLEIDQTPLRKDGLFSGARVARLDQVTLQPRLDVEVDPYELIMEYLVEHDPRRRRERGESVPWSAGEGRQWEHWRRIAQRHHPIRYKPSGNPDLDNLVKMFGLADRCYHGGIVLGFTPYPCVELLDLGIGLGVLLGSWSAA